MKILSAVTEHGGGYAWLQTGLPVAECTPVIIERDAEKNCFLGPQGWQSQPAEIETLSSTRSGALLLGPNIVDCLKDGDYVTIRIAGTGYEESDFWPAIPMSGRKAKDSTGMTRNEPARSSVPSSTTTMPMSASVHATQSHKPPEEAVMPQQEDSVGAVLSQNSRKLSLFIGAALMLLIVAGGGYITWRLIPDGTLASLSERVTTATSDFSAVILGERRDTAYWTGVLRDPAATPEKLYNSAIDTRESAETQGISHEFLYQAAARGNTQAQRDYSRLYDPTVTGETGWQAQKNARTALEFYTKIRDGGDRTVTADINRVCDFLKPGIFSNAGSRTAFDDYCSN